MARGPMTPLLRRLRKALCKAADPAKAPAMRAYMKSELPYHGVPVPEMRRVCREVFAELALPTASAWRASVLGLWRGAGYREERYGALALAGDRRAEPFQTPAAMGMYEELVVSGAWWDYVDDIAAHRVGPILVRHPGPMKKLMLSWSRSGDTWKRRVSILCQLGFKGKTDLGLLYGCIEPSLGSGEFFLRKAIGWALREYAWTDPREIRRYVRLNASRLSPLSRREAVKNIGRRTNGLLARG